MLKLCLLLTACILAIVSAQGQSQDLKSCRAVFSEQNRKQLTWINRCVKELGYKSAREKTQKSTCVWKCVLDNFNMLNDDGNLDKDQYNKHLTEEWPSHMLDRANTTFQPCLKIGGETTQDEFCKGYDPLVKCLTRNFANLCKGIK